MFPWTSFAIVLPRFGLIAVFSGAHNRLFHRLGIDSKDENAGLGVKIEFYRFKDFEYLDVFASVEIVDEDNEIVGKAFGFSCLLSSEFSCLLSSEFSCWINVLIELRT